MSYRYIGNKTRLVDTLLTCMEEHIGPGSVLADPMCGTAAMAAGMRARGHRVVAGDLLTFPVLHATVRLMLDGPPPFAGLGMTYADALRTLNATEPERGLFFREYGHQGEPAAGCSPRRYLTAANAGRVDGIRRRLTEWQPLLNEVEHALLRHDLILAVNRVANIAGTYGHYRSSWSAAALKPLALRPTAFDAGPTDGHRVLHGPVEEVASEITADACYLDPPYMKRQYAANYHLLETLARGDEPEAIGVSGLRDWWDQYSDFCSKRRVADAFAAAVQKMDCPLFFISYSEDGLLSGEQMVRLFSDFGSVERREFPLQRFRSNAGGAGGVLTEYLYVVRKGA